MERAAARIWIIKGLGSGAEREGIREEKWRECGK